jgi:hypothetical protein
MSSDHARAGAVLGLAASAVTASRANTANALEWESVRQQIEELDPDHDEIEDVLCAVVDYLGRSPEELMAIWLEVT